MQTHGGIILVERCVWYAEFNFQVKVIGTVITSVESLFTWLSSIIADSR